MTNPKSSVEDNAYVFIAIEGSDPIPRFAAYIAEPPCRLCGTVLPTFGSEVATQIVAWNNGISENDEDNPICEWTADGEILCYYNPDRPGAHYVWSRDAHGRYPLGRGRWAWQLADAIAVKDGGTK